MPTTRIDKAGANNLTDNNNVKSGIDASDPDLCDMVEADSVIVPAAVSETWEDHFLVSGLSTFQNAIDAGYSFFLQPTGRQVATFTAANTERLKRTDNAALSITGNMTISCWIKATNVTTVQSLVAKYNGTGSQRSYRVTIESDSKANITVSADGSATVGISSSGTLTAATWYHLVGKYDGSNIAIIIDDGTPTTTAMTGSLYDATADFFVGASGDGTVDPFGGNIRNVGIWSRALGADEITELYNSGVPLYYDQMPLHLKTNLVSFWDLNEKSSGAGAITRKDSHSTNDLTDENTVTSTSALDVAIIERIIDFGVLLSSSIVEITYAETSFSGALTIATKIAISTDGTTFGAFTTGSSVFATTVQAVKVRFEATPDSNTAFSELNSMRVRLTVKKTRDTGSVEASADDDSGTSVTFNLDFLDVETILVTPKTIQRVALFDPANSESLSIADNATVSTGDIDFAIAGWVYFNTLDANMGLCCKWTTSSNQREYAIWLDGSTNKIQFDVSNDGAATVSRIASTFGVIQKHQWYFVVAEHDASGNTISMQTNNGTIDSTSHTTGVYNSTASLSLGARDGSNYLDGRLANWGLWKRTLTSAERKTLYNAGYTYKYSEMAGSLTTSLAVFWPLNEASGARSDEVGSNTLTDNNTVMSYIIAKTSYFSFNDVASPTGFDVLVYDSNGIRVSSPVDWIAEGYINPI